MLTSRAGSRVLSSSHRISTLAPSVEIPLALRVSNSRSRLSRRFSVFNSRCILPIRVPSRDAHTVVVTAIRTQYWRSQDRYASPISTLAQHAILHLVCRRQEVQRVSFADDPCCMPLTPYLSPDGLDHLFEYELSTVVNHEGATGNNGHYTSVCLADDVRVHRLPSPLHR